MTTKRLFLFSLLLIAALVLSACTGSRTIVNNWPGLAADADRAYVAGGSFVYGVNIKTGVEVWRYPDSANNALHYYANPVITPDGQLLIGSAGTKHDFVSINPVTGKDNWAAPFTGAKGIWVASPLVANNHIYAPNTDGYLYILNLDGSFVDSVYLGGALWSAPVTDGKFIYVASLDHHVHVIDPGNLKSNKTVDVGGAIPGGLTVTPDGGAYVGTFASKVDSVTPSGNQNAVAAAQGWVWGAPALDGQTLYYADLDGNVYSYDVGSGKQNWEVKPDGPIAASPVVIGDQIFVATEAGSLVALDRDGKFQSYQVGGKIYTTPVVSGDLILVAPYQAAFTLMALTVDGKQAWPTPFQPASK